MEVKIIGKTTDNIAIAAAAGRLSRAKGTTLEIVNKSFEKTEEENNEFIKKVINMGHTSIIDHCYFNFAIENVSPVIEQLLISSRYCSLTIKSRREVNFADKNYYVPVFKDESGKLLDNQEHLVNLYKNNMDNLFDTYQKLVDKGIALEDARYLLPYCFPSQIIFGASATEIIRIIISFTKGFNSNIPEAVCFGEKLKEELIKEAPYIESIIEESKAENIDYVSNLLNTCVKGYYDTIRPSINLNSNNGVNLDDKIAINAIMKYAQVSYEKAIEIYEQEQDKDPNFLRKLFESIKKDINKDHLESIYFKFALPISFANLTHITRHRKVDLTIPDFVNTINNDLNILIPPKILEDQSCVQLFNDAVNLNKENLLKLKEAGVRKEDLIYFILSGNIVNIVTGFDGETFRHVSSLRACKKAQWEIRGLLVEMMELLKNHGENYYNIVGASCAVNGTCPEGLESCKAPYLSKKIK